MAYEPRYNHVHRALRARWRPVVEAGGVVCWRCSKPIDPRGKWHLGHDDDDPSRYKGPEHVRCNIAASNRPGDPPPRVRAWWS